MYYNFRMPEYRRSMIEGGTFFFTTVTFGRAPILTNIGPGGEPNPSRLQKGEAAIWQRRFWEHTIWDEQDLNHHLDYIHYNPVRHGLVKRPAEWPWTSFHRYERMGFYEKGWGDAVAEKIESMRCGE